MDYDEVYLMYLTPGVGHNLTKAVSVYILCSLYRNAIQDSY